MESLSALGAFMSAAEARSFAGAGRQLNLSSSAVRKAVSRLEEQLGVRLFHRSTRHVALTEDGTKLLKACRNIFREIKNVEIEFAQIERSPTGTLRVSLPLVGMPVMPTLARFMHKYPEIELDIDFTDQLVDPVAGGYDIVVRTGDITDSQLTSRRLGAFSMEIVGSPAYFARAGMPSKPEDLTTHACLHYRHPATGRLQRWPLDASAAATDLVLPVTAASSTTEGRIVLPLRGGPSREVARRKAF
jgi:DNA-binding transcriptional LysR family regulator